MHADKYDSGHASKYFCQDLTMIECLPGPLFFSLSLPLPLLPHSPSIVCCVCDPTDYNSYGRLVCTLSGLATAQWTSWLGLCAGQWAGVKVHPRQWEGWGGEGVLH